MNKTKIEYGDYAWNPVTGCKHGCPYCWARAMCKRYKRTFEPTFHEDRVDDPMRVKKPGRVLVSFMGDLFGDWVPKDWIEQVIAVCKIEKRHKYLFLTKNPKRYIEFKFPDNCWLGITTDFKYNTLSFTTERTFISYEPLLGIGYLMPAAWYIIGAQTKPEIQPKKEWIERILNEADKYGTPVFMKDNLKWDGEKRRKYPEGLR